jgi:hypothetical protein
LFVEDAAESEQLDLALVRADGWREVKIYNELIRSGETEAMNLYYRGYGYQMAGDINWRSTTTMPVWQWTQPTTLFACSGRAPKNCLILIQSINQSMNE